MLLSDGELAFLRESADLPEVVDGAMRRGFVVREQRPAMRTCISGSLCWFHSWRWQCVRIYTNTIHRSIALLAEERFGQVRRTCNKLAGEHAIRGAGKDTAF